VGDFVSRVDERRQLAPVEAVPPLGWKKPLRGCKDTRPCFSKPTLRFHREFIFKASGELKSEIRLLSPACARLFHLQIGELNGQLARLTDP
jgi:hypothetical protein